MPEITVTVDDEHLHKISEVAAAARARGLRISEVNTEVGVISGSVDADNQAAVESVPGVSSVEESASYQLPPSDSPLQ